MSPSWQQGEASRFALRHGIFFLRVEGTLLLLLPFLAEPVLYLRFCCIALGMLHFNYNFQRWMSRLEQR